MKKRVGRARRDRGVTLVEMAIVVLIIGVILGAVLSGRVIMENQKINKFLQLLDELPAAVNTYKERFGQLPGDDAAASTRFTGARNGNGDGLWPNGGPTNNIADERNLVVDHLIRSGLLQSGSTTNVAGTQVRFLKAPGSGRSVTRDLQRDWDRSGTTTVRRAIHFQNVSRDTAKRLLEAKGNVSTANEMIRGPIHCDTNPFGAGGQVQIFVVLD